MLSWQQRQGRLDKRFILRDVSILIKLIAPVNVVLTLQMSDKTLEFF